MPDPKLFLSLNDPICKIVLMRNGEHYLSDSGVITGWIDTKLTKKGINSVKKAAELLKNHGFDFGAIHTSQLQRGKESAEIIRKELGVDEEVEIKKSWKLNERHYGKYTA